MSQPLTELDPSVTSGNSPPVTMQKSPANSAVTAMPDKAKPSAATEEPFAEKTPKRTLGLRVLDFFVYWIFNNTFVFVISVAATYLTTRGGDKTHDGKLIYGKLGHFCHQRGEWFIKKCETWLGMSHKAADAAKMVAFSFIDGSIVSIAVKLFENKREQLGSWIDNLLGTRPPDDRAYEAEPTQTWTSVGLGRLGAAAIVAPTAMFLHEKGLNDKWFYKPAEQWAEKHPNIVKRFGKLDAKEIIRVSLFELVYTSICTAGLYFGSRIIARFLESPEKKHHHDAPPAIDKATIATDTKSSDTAQPAPAKPAPDHKIGHAVRDGNLAATAQTMQMQ